MPQPRPLKKLGFRHDRVPSPMAFCRCSECRLHQYVDTQEREVKMGCMIALNLFREHQKRERMKEAALQRLEQTDPAPPDPFIHFPEKAQAEGSHPLIWTSPTYAVPLPEYNNPNPKTKSSTPLERKGMKHKISDTSTLYSLLCSFRTRLRLRPVTLFFQERSILFSRPPTKVSSKLPGYLDLDPCAPQNQAILTHERWLRDGLRRLEVQLKMTRCQTSSHERLLGMMVIRDIRTALNQLEKYKSEEWDRQHTVIKERSAPVINTATYISARTLIMEPLTCITFLFVAFLHLLANVSRQNCNTALLSIALLLRIALQDSNNPESVAILESMPQDTRTVIDSLGIEPKTRAFVCCPKCFCTYSFDVDPGTFDVDADDQELDSITAEHVPQFCSFKQTENSPPCSERLRATNASNDFLTRQFVYQDLHHWIGRMYARPDIEEYFDNYPDNCFDGQKMHDIWDGSILQDFKGPDGQPFMRSSGNEGRLVFGLNVDGFNAHGISNSGKTLSIGGMYMVCFNLPPEIRYNIENVYLVGIIPGPDEPSTSEINHFLRPLVDGLLVLWQDGIHLSRTPKHRYGRLTRAALIPLICDLPAARRVSGLGAHSFRLFCSECRLSIAEINNVDSSKWERRTQEEHRKEAENWKNAQTASDQAKLFKMHGIRWSELLRLPYWDPTKHIVIDSMHGFYLRMFSRHIRDIWGMSVAFKDGTGLNFDLEEKDVTEGERILRFGSSHQVEGLREPILKYLCHQLELPLNGPKESLCKSLMIYRVEQGWFYPDGTVNPHFHFTEPTVSPSEGPFFGPPTEEEFLLKAYEARSDAAIRAFKKATLVALCVKKFKGNPQHYEGSTKSVLAALVIQLRERERTEQQSKEHELDDENCESPKGTKVLGKKTLKAIQEDMGRLNLPTWVTPPPKRPGESKGGKFKADEWKIFCTVNLPITLARLWGSKPETNRYHRMLKNYMELVAAVKIATKRSITALDLVLYDGYIKAYLTGLLELYPHMKLTPYHHLSLHFSAHLGRFGPTHAWRCYPFERYNGLLQKLPDNHKFGQLETTKLLRFCRSQNLRALFHEAHLPPATLPIIATMEKRFKVSIPETILPRRSPDEHKSLSREIFMNLQDYQLLSECLKDRDTDTVLRKKMLPLKTVHLLGRSYEPSPSKNSFVMVRLSDTEIVAAKIQSIFSHTQRTAGPTKPQNSKFVKIQLFKTLSPIDSLRDPYRQFLFSGGQLYYNCLSTISRVIPFEDIVVHFAQTPMTVEGISGECLHVLPLPCT